MDKIKVTVIASLAAIALIVTVVLYKLFLETNEAIFSSAGTKLGGAVAFFFVLFVAELKAYTCMRCDNLAPIRKALSGKWRCTAEVKSEGESSPKCVYSTADIQQREDGKITLIGETEGNTETWEADEVILTDSKLVFFFDVPLLKISGVTNLRFTYSNKSPLKEMKGYWILAGREGRGNVSFVRTG